MLFLILSTSVHITSINLSHCVAHSLGVVQHFLHITNITCAGNETHLWDCPFNNATEIKCNYYNQVAVHCGRLLLYTRTT